MISSDYPNPDPITAYPGPEVTRGRLNQTIYRTTVATMINLDNPEYYINRELSLIQFNRRVLEQARDDSIPLLERLRFLCIASSNLDEFFEVRVAGLVHRIDYGSVQTSADNLSSSEILSRISTVAHTLVKDQYSLLNDTLLPSLQCEGVCFPRRSEWNKAQATWVRDYFEQQILPIISPIRLDPAHPFPRVRNKSLHFIVQLDGNDVFGRPGGMAVAQAPRLLPRLIRLPDNVASGPFDFVFLSSIIHAQVGDLFPGLEVTGCYQFRVTRNSELFVDPEEVDDLLRALEGELPSRRYGDEVRLEVADNCPDEVLNYLLRQFQLNPQMVFRVNGPVNLHRLRALPELVERPDLKWSNYTPKLPSWLAQSDHLFETIRNQDVLLHHPFESFAPVIDLVRQAAIDPDVLAIKQTLYRTGPESAIVHELVQAARAGKEVTVVVELRARFDEEANISLASRLQEAGANVVYGIVGHKTHAKMLLIVRTENGKLNRYVHLGTGNYHARTARIYTDYGLLTTNPEICADVHKIFMQLTSLGASLKLTHLLQSPFTLQQGLLDLIDTEIDNANQGKPAYIIAKMNALIEKRLIQALYRASQAGVSIDLIVRGICGLRPGVPGISDNIRVRSIVGRFLEHTRVFCFKNGGTPKVFCSSADWMDRNLHQRVEVCFPILNPDLRERIIKQGLLYYLEDNMQAWELGADGEWTQSTVNNTPKLSAQQRLLETLTE